jgi:hypothetical protein
VAEAHAGGGGLDWPQRWLSGDGWQLDHVVLVGVGEEEVSTGVDRHILRTEQSVDALSDRRLGAVGGDLDDVRVSDV